jgi:hypothetical protein
MMNAVNQDGSTLDSLERSELFLVNENDALQSPRSLSNRATCVILVMTPALTAIPALGGIPNYLHVLPSLIFTVGCFLAFPLQSRRASATFPAIVWAGFGALTFVALMRLAADPGKAFTPQIVLNFAFTVLTLCVFLYLAIVHTDDVRAKSRMNSILFAPAFLASTSLLLHFLKVSIGGPATSATGLAQSPGSAEMLHLIGINTERVQLPLYQSINGGGVLGGCAVAIGIFMCRAADTRTLRTLGGVSLVAGLATVLLADSRGTIAFTALACLLVGLVPKSSKKIISAVPLLLPFAPFAILYTTGTVLAKHGSEFSRQGGDIATATGRQFVWTDVIHKTTEFNLNSLTGYGAFGQAKSGVGHQYAYLFNIRNPDYANAHNGMLQSALDIGWIGVACLIALMSSCIYVLAIRLQALPSAANRALLAGLMSIALVGAVEAVPSTNNFSLLATFFALSAAAIRTPAE